MPDLDVDLTTADLSVLDWAPVCEYEDKAGRVDCRLDRQPAAWLVWTAPLHCTPAQVRFFCAGCWDRRQTWGYVTCYCGTGRIHPRGNVLRVESVGGGPRT